MIKFNKNALFIALVFFSWRKEEVVAQRDGKSNGYSHLIIFTLTEKKKKKSVTISMEFPFDINIILPLEITILNGDYRILNHGYATKILYVVSKVFC